METKTVFAALVGRPNVGKSSLLNYLLGEKVAIVTSKPQTTRNRIVGILTKCDTQYVFIDTPGLHRPRNRLGSYMMHQTQASVSEVNLVILVTEWEKPISNVERAFCRSIAARKIPAILAINKIDLLRQKDILLEKIRLFKDLHDFDATVLISAKTGDGVARLLDETEKFCVNAPHMFDDDALTDQPERAVVAEIIREKILNNLHEEIPHGTAVIIEAFKEREKQAIIDIDATIVCEKQSHKAIIIGCTTNGHV